MADRDDPLLIDAGIAAAPLIAEPKSWINRRVETIELLSGEQTRRRVSIDFTLTDAQLASLRIQDGIVAPISLLAKERLRAFDLRDEAGAAIPALGREQNGELSLVALSSAASAALGTDVPAGELEQLTADLRRIVFEPARTAEGMRAEFARKAAVAGSSHAVVNADPRCAALLDALWTNYVLFAVLVAGGPNRRILKYAYGDEVDLSWATGRLDRSFGWGEIGYRVRYPDRRWFLIDCPGAWRARSFHAEVVIPEELRFDLAMLSDSATDRPLSAFELGVNRAALYADEEIDSHQDVSAALEIAPEAAGRLNQASTTSLIVAALLWLGVASGLRGNSPDAAVSILLGGAALFSGVTAVLGEHRLVSAIFSATRRWLLVVTAAALLASASLAMAPFGSHPVGTWRVAAVTCTVAAVRLTWSSIRARA